MTATLVESPVVSKHLVRTAAHLLDELGVPPHRVWLSPTPGSATEQDVVYADEHLDRLCELVDGTLVEKAMGNAESLIALAIASVIRTFVVPRKLGLVVGADSMFRLFPGQLRMPDVAFISIGRLPKGFLQEPVANFAPDLAVEVLSQSNTTQEIQRKLSEYFASGVKACWIVDPRARTVAVHSTPETFELKNVADQLDGGVAIPGFSVHVADLFAELDLQPSA